MHTKNLYHRDIHVLPCIWFTCTTYTHQGKTILLSFISVRDGPERSTQQGRDESVQEDYSTMERWQKRKTKRPPYICCTLYIPVHVEQSSSLSFLPLFRSRVVFLHAFIRALFQYILQDTCTRMLVTVEREIFTSENFRVLNFHVFYFHHLVK